MNRKNQVFGFGNAVTLGVATYVGGGNTADLTVPANAVAAKSHNMASTGVRTGEGVYDCVLSEDAAQPEVLAVIAVCAGAGHRAEVTTDYVASTRKVVVTTRNASGTADDLPTTDKLKLILIGHDSGS